MRDDKKRLLAVALILQQHPKGICVNEILSILMRIYDIKTGRKTIYSDIAAISAFYTVSKTYTSNNKRIYKIINNQVNIYKDVESTLKKK